MIALTSPLRIACSVLPIALFLFAVRTTPDMGKVFLKIRSEIVANRIRILFNRHYFLGGDLPDSYRSSYTFWNYQWPLFGW